MPAPKTFVSPESRLLTQSNSVGRPRLRKKTARVSTFPTRFESLRERLFERAKETPAFLATVFTLNDAGPTEDEIMQSVENRLFSLIKNYPSWFGQTKEADARSRAAVRAYRIQRGLIQPEAVPAGLAEWRRKQKELCLEEIEDETTDQEETTQEHLAAVAI
jgi:hypothetical protein